MTDISRTQAWLESLRPKTLPLAFAAIIVGTTLAWWQGHFDPLVAGLALVTAGLLVRREFAEAHPDAVAKFLEEYAASVDYVNENPAEAAVLVEAQGIVKAAVAEKAIPYCSLVCITGADMKTAVSGYLQTLYDLKPETVGGAMPDDGFYWMET